MTTVELVSAKISDVLLPANTCKVALSIVISAVVAPVAVNLESANNE
ncbi:hypothetical protein [Pseudomonas sp.]